MSDLNPNNTVEIYQKRRKRQIVLTFVLVPLIALALMVQYKFVSLGSLKDLFGMVFFGCVVLGIAFSFINWRCPACNKYLGRELNLLCCKGCGADFED
jgi:Na+/citrate or Na+/malate symporter